MAKARKYWSMSAKGPKSAEVLIYEQIGAGFFEDGIGAKDFARELKDLGELDELAIRINSPGGSVFEGQAIYSQLKAHRARKTVHIDGLAASIASVIAMAGDTIIMPENATMMIHDPWTMAVGNAEEMRKQADALDVVKKGIVAAYRDKSGLSDEEISDLMSAETWMSADDALGRGFVDEVIEPAQMAALVKFDLSMYKKAPEVLALLRAQAQPKAQEPSAPAAPAAAQNAPPKGVTAMKCKKHPGTDMIVDSCPVCDHEASVAASVEKAKLGEVARAKALRAIGKEFKMVDLAEYGVENGWSEETLRTEVLNRIKTASAGGPLNITIAPAHEGKPFRSFGEQLLAIRAAALGDHTAQQKLREVYNAPSGASEGVPSDGGVLVQSDFTTSLLDRSNETSVIAPRCSTIQVSGNGLYAPIIDETTRATGSRWGGVQIYRVNEAGTATAKKPKLGTLEMKLEKLIGVFYGTDELLADASALESIATKAFTEEFGFIRDNEIINGTGAGQMLGILNAGSLVSVSKEGGQLAATIVADNIIKMYSRMPARSKANAVWLINSECMPEIMKLNMTLGTAGFPMFTPPGGLSASPYGTLFGKPIIEIEQAAALGTVGDIMFVDLSQYAIIEKGGLNAAQSIHVQFLQDETCFRWTYRCNGQPIWKSALTPFKGSATVSPFVALATRA